MVFAVILVHRQTMSRSENRRNFDIVTMNSPLWVSSSSSSPSSPFQYFGYVIAIVMVILPFTFLEINCVLVYEVSFFSSYFFPFGFLDVCDCSLYVIVVVKVALVSFLRICGFFVCSVGFG